MLSRTAQLLRPSALRAALPAARAGYSSSSAPTDLSSGLNADQQDLRSTVSTFFQKEVAPLAESTDKNNEFPMHLWEKFGEMGLLGTRLLGMTTRQGVLIYGSTRYHCARGIRRTR